MSRANLKLILSFLFVYYSTGFSQTIGAIDYLGQTPPGNTPKVFPLSVTIGLRAVERISISSDGKEIYYSELNTYPPTELRIKCYKYLNNKWEGPSVVFEGYNAPALSANNNVMYMQKNINNLPYTFFSTRNSSGWTTPTKLLSTKQQTHYFQETNLKNCYVSSALTTSSGNSDLFKLVVNNTDTTLQSLGAPINTSATENDFFMAKDESYLLVCRTPSGSASDLYISYKNDKGNWTNPKSLGVQINTPNPNWEYGPFVSNDNKYLFFTRGGNAVSSYYVYWVRFDGLLDSLKHTNFIPYQKSQIPNQVCTLNVPFNYQVPDSIFIDDDGNNTLTYSAVLGNGSALPSWLHFDSATKTFSGTPAEKQSYTIKITATDNTNALVSTTFSLTVKELTIDYLGQTPPGSTPKIFQLPVSAGCRAQERISISPDGSQIYYTELNTSGPTGIKYMSYKNNKWNSPVLLFSGYWNPVLSPSGDTLYFLDGNNKSLQKNNPDAWYSVKKDSIWSAPVKFWNRKCSKGSFQKSDMGNYYFSTIIDSLGTNGVIVRLKISSKDTLMQSLGSPINSEDAGSFYVSRDESYIIFTSQRTNSPSLVISYHKNDGTWTNPKNLGANINFSGWWPWASYVSPDNKYLFYSNGSNISNSATYWVSLGNLIDSLRHTNFVPYLKTKIPNLTDTVGKPLTYQVPDNIFIDDDGNNTLTYSAVLSNGSALPSWLHFDSTTKTFSGTPAEKQSYTIKITATDNTNALVSTTFSLTVKELTIDYLGQTPPGNSPKLFAPGILSTTTYHENTCSFSPDGTELIFTRWINDNTPKLYYSKYSNGAWSSPAEKKFTGLLEMEAIFAPYGSQLFFAAGSSFPNDIYKVVKNGNDWLNPTKVSNVSSSSDEFFGTLTMDTTMYFQRGYSAIYSAKYKNGSFLTPEKLNSPINSTTKQIRHPFISPDESYLIFESGDGQVNDDIMISFRKTDKTWAEPKKLESGISTSQFECQPTLSPDGKYLFFTRGNPQDIYWVKIDNIIDSLKKSFISDIKSNDARLPSSFDLFQNYPNPFNPSTIISYQISVAGHVLLKVFDLLGREVATLVDEYKQPGFYNSQFSIGNLTAGRQSSQLSSGVYFYSLTSNEMNIQKKMMLIR